MNKAEPLTGEELRSVKEYLDHEPWCPKGGKPTYKMDKLLSCQCHVKPLTGLLATLKAVIEAGDNMKTTDTGVGYEWEALVGPYRDALEGGENEVD